MCVFKSECVFVCATCVWGMKAEELFGKMKRERESCL